MRKNRKPRNPDRVMAQHVDPAFYYQTQACASLDDEIENDERPKSGMPFGGENHPIRTYDCHDEDCYCQ